MKIEVNLERKYFISLLIVGLMLIGFVGVYAYNSSPRFTTQGDIPAANPALFGHSVDEMNWNTTIKGNLTASGFCMNNSGIMDCRTVWPSSISSQWITSGNDIYYNVGNVSTTNFMKAAGVCIGSDCRNVWPSGGGSGGPITTSDCQEVSVNGCDGAVSSHTWSSCPSGKVVTGVKYRYSLSNCGGFYVSGVQCCALSGGGGGGAAITHVTGVFSANATNGCASGCAKTTNCTGDWDFCAITQEDFKLYDDVTDRKHDIWQCKVYYNSSIGAWKVYAYYNGGGDAGGYMNCSATCIKFSLN